MKDFDERPVVAFMRSEEHYEGVQRALQLIGVVAKAMDFNPLEVGCLHHLSDWGFGVIDLDRIELRRVPLERSRRNFKPHSSYREQLN